MKTIVYYSFYTKLYVFSINLSQVMEGTYCPLLRSSKKPITNREVKSIQKVDINSYLDPMRIKQHIAANLSAQLFYHFVKHFLFLSHTMRFGQI